MNKPLVNIIDLSFQELQRELELLDEPSFRAKQIHQWLFSHQAKSFEEMTTLSRPLRQKLAESFSISHPELVDHLESTLESGENLTEKVLLKLPDNELVETVLIPAENRLTACLSSQAGCAFQCTFCATGQMGLHRNLTAGEITGQVYALNAIASAKNPERKITNIVFMGMGEPLMNYDNVIESIETLSTRNYSSTVSQKKITISTVGVIPQIRKLATSGLKTKLAVSLHAAEQQKRESLMPVAAHLYPLKELGKSLAEYSAATSMPVTIVYMLLKGINDSPEDAKMLVRFAHGFLCKINLIDYNSIINIRFKPVNSSSREMFLRHLIDSGLHVTIRKSYGTTINAACGQLATTGMKESQ
ncbi:MAG: 23S rRNA (adenine(2503)-C(2))-methyltransferase RlmN [Chlorobiaceae bacterium]|nr:23S rRNA (adenine(2503)-C(2))-methyltransferase RlmN [Chlorobiaceae bacterium]